MATDGLLPPRELENLVRAGTSGYHLLQAASRWAHTRFRHDGANQAPAGDPISILRGAAAGGTFRCVEYSILLRALINALGIPARVLCLKTEDSETRTSGAGHVVVEAFLSELAKWVMVDGQWDVVPTLGGRPLHAVELRQALREEREGLAVVSQSGTRAADYLPWITPYLFYMDTELPGSNGHGVTRLMLVPAGARTPTRFQGRPLSRVHFIRDEADFYRAPLASAEP